MGHQHALVRDSAVLETCIQSCSRQGTVQGTVQGCTLQPLAQSARQREDY